MHEKLNEIRNVEKNATIKWLWCTTSVKRICWQGL